MTNIVIKKSCFYLLLPYYLKRENRESFSLLQGLFRFHINL